MESPSARNYSKLTMVWAVTACRQLPCCFMSPIAQASLALFLLKHHASSFRWCYIPNHLKKLYNSYGLRNDVWWKKWDVWCMRAEEWRQQAWILFWDDIRYAVALNNFLRCDKRPGKRSFNGKGKTEEKSQSSLWAQLLWLRLERGEQPRLLAHR